MSITMIGLDIAKSVFQLHGIDASGKAQLKRKLRRSELIPFFERQPRCTVVMEACGAAHHWARAPKGMSKLEELAALVEGDESFPERAGGAFAGLLEHCRTTARRIAALEAEIVAHARGDDTARRLATVPGIGPIAASLVAATVGDGIRNFRSARHFAAWLGLVPRQHSTGGKTRLGRITKAGNREIRRLLVLGATAMVHRAAQWNSAAGAWTRGLLERRPARLATVALANKIARIAWVLMARKEVYRATGHAAAASAAT